MKGIQELEQLVQLTHQLLDHLETEELSVESIRQMMDRREECIRELGKISKADHRKFLSSAEQKNLEILFDTFALLDEELRKLLNETFQKQQSRLAETSRNKRAVKSYRKTSETPDNSFY